MWKTLRSQIDTNTQAQHLSRLWLFSLIRYVQTFHNIQLCKSKVTSAQNLLVRCIIHARAGCKSDAWGEKYTVTDVDGNGTCARYSGAVQSVEMECLITNCCRGGTHSRSCLSPWSTGAHWSLSTYKSY